MKFNLFEPRKHERWLDQLVRAAAGLPIKKLLRAAAFSLLLSLPTGAFPQNPRLDGEAQGPKGTIPFAFVAVCSQPANTSISPCTPLANLCSSLTDVTCTQPNPVLADNLGNYQFYAKRAQAPFTVQIYGPQISVPYVINDQAPGAGTATNNTFVGTNTFNGAATFVGNSKLVGTNTLSSVNGALNPASCAGSPAPSWCAGSDVGGWINAAYAALPSNGGEIAIPTGSFSFSTPIVANTVHKPVRIHGAGNAATTLTYTGTTGIAITLDTGVNNFASELDHFKLVGSGVGNSTTGVSWGSVNGSTYASADSVQVTAFGTGMSFPNSQDFLWAGLRVMLSNNGQNLVNSGGLENNRCVSCVFALDTPGTTGTTANSVAITAASDWYFFGCSFDNVQLALSNNSTARVFGGHFENPAQNSYDFFTSSGNNIEFHGVQFNQDNSSSFPNGRFGSAIAGGVGIYGGSAFSPLNIATVVALSGTASGHNHGLQLNSTFTSGWATNSGSGYTDGFAQDSIGNTVVQNVMQAGTLRSNAIQMGNSSPELLCSATAPTISSGFNAGTIGSGANGTCSFLVNVGTGTAGSTGVLILPTATSGWSCFAQNQARAAVIQQTGNSTTSCTLTNFGSTFSATNWTNGDPILVIAVGR